MKEKITIFIFPYVLFHFGYSQQQQYNLGLRMEHRQQVFQIGLFKKASPSAELLILIPDGVNTSATSKV
jgi:hypothetical protein